MKKLKNIKVLIVDDDEMMREVLASFLADEGALTLEAENGTRALKMVQKNKFDIVLSDVRMPGGDGITLAKNISQMMENRPLVFICSGLNDLSKEVIKLYGIEKVFEKPFDHRTLIDEIQINFSGIKL